MVEITRSGGELRKEVDTLKESMEELKAMMATMLAQQHHPVVAIAGNSTDNSSEAHRTGNTSYHIPTKMSHVEFPRFNGEDLCGWLYRSEQFFEVNETPPTTKVKLGSVHLEGKALQWHQMFMKSRLTREIPNWEEYVRALNDRFRALVFDDPMSELMNLKQIHYVQQYLDSFDEIVNYLDLPDPYALSCFLGGLKSEISINVRMFRPKSMQEAIILAKLQEQALALNGRKQPQGFLRPSVLPARPPQSHSIPRFNGEQSRSLPPLLPTPTQRRNHTNRPTVGQSRRLSSQEMDDKRSKGLCYWCDEKFTREHNCKNRKHIYLMEVPQEELEECEDEEDIGQTVEEEQLEQVEESHISMHVITGIHDFKTMRVTGVVKGRPIHILIDTGSTHNFVDLEAAKRLGCRLEPITPFAVSVADGNRILSSFICKDFSWKMQGIRFTTSLMTIPLGGCDMVLGMQWLVTLGDISWNFSQLKMEFHTAGHRVVLRGMQPTIVKLKNKNQMTKLMNKNAAVHATSGHL